MGFIDENRVQEYISELKIIPEKFDHKFKDKGCGHIQADHIITGKNGTQFSISIRQSKFNPLDFSVILGVIIGNRVNILARYNGDHGEHTNKLTGEKFSGCHIHRVKNIYQDHGWKAEGHAEPTKKYADWQGALQTLLQENNFQLKNQRRVTEEWKAK